jgi:hypothetical protein
MGEGWDDNQGMGQEAKRGKGEVMVEGKGQQGKAEIAAALAAQVPVNMEKDGIPIVVAGTVMCNSLKNNDKYGGRPRSSA